MHFTSHKTSKDTMRYPQSLGWKKEGRRECHSYNPFLNALRMGRQRSLTKQSDNRNQHVTHSGNPSQAIPSLNHNQIRRQRLNKEDSEVTLNAPNTGKESFSGFARKKWPEHSMHRTKNPYCGLEHEIIRYQNELPKNFGTISWESKKHTRRVP